MEYIERYIINSEPLIWLMVNSTPSWGMGGR